MDSSFLLNSNNQYAHLCHNIDPNKICHIISQYEAQISNGFQVIISL